MKQGFIVILMMAFIPGIFAQTKFSKGYYIDHEDRRVECLIDIQQTQKTPTEFLWKLTEADVPKTESAVSVKEFGITGGKKYISALVNIDISSDDEKNPSDKADPDWSEQRVFLEVLIEGEATLYHYQEMAMERFFYKVRDGKMQQLVRKYFRKPEDDRSVLRKNELFHQQLLSDVRAGNVSIHDISVLNYETKELLAYFVSYDRGSGKNFQIFTRKREYPSFHVGITPGFRYTFIKLTDFDVPNYAGVRAGVEAEMVFPYTNGQVSFVVEPSFFYYSGSGISRFNKIKVDLKYLELPIGFRYSFFHTMPVKAFIDGFFIPAIPLAFQSDVRLNNYLFHSTPRSCVAFGAGVSWKRFSAEARYYTGRKIMVNLCESKYSALCVILGFRIF